MVKNLKRFRKQLEREQGKTEAIKCDFFPMTYELPVSTKGNTSFSQKCLYLKVDLD